MTQPDRFAPWVALLALVLFGLFLQRVLKPLPFLTSQPQMAARPAAHFELLPVPGWPVQVPTATGPGLSLVDVAG